METNEPTLSGVEIGDKIYVGGLGEAIVSPEGIEAHYVEEPDLTKSWQLHIARGDSFIESVRVKPITEG